MKRGNRSVKMEGPEALTTFNAAISNQRRSDLFDHRKDYANPLQFNILGIFLIGLRIL